MLGQVQRTNLNRVFDTLDLTGDGFISQDDFASLAQRMRSLRPGLDHQLAAEIDQAFSGWWQHFSTADTDGDGQVSREEFLNAVENGLQKQPGFADQMVRVSQVTFRAADIEGNGQLTREQVRNIYRAYGVDEEHSAATFERLDRDGDGVITVDEYVQAARDVYLSDDENAPGAVMFGPVT
jgi:Ca2+-binding EF-hand superfamily protein